jgi:hypothetical protein
VQVLLKYIPFKPYTHSYPVDKVSEALNSIEYK